MSTLGEEPARREGEDNGAPSAAFDAWRHLGRPRHALALALLCGALALRFQGALVSSAPLGDEIAYAKAMDNVAAGRSPYAAGDYLYPPTFARLGIVLRRLGSQAPLIASRTANLIGLAVLVWCAAAWLAAGFALRVALAVGYVVVAPAVAQGIELGNLTFLVAGATVLALTLWPRRAGASGMLLAATLPIKPLATGALFALAAPRATWQSPRRLLSLVLPLAAAASALLLDPALPAFLDRVRMVGSGRSVSPHRFLHLAGLSSLAPWLTLAVLASTALLAHLYGGADKASLIALALAGSVLALPLVWNHTLVLTLPLQTMAVTVSIARFRGRPPGDRRRRWELLVVVLAVAAAELAEGATGVDDRGTLLQVTATLPPCLAPPCLAGYVLRFGRDDRVKRDRLGEPAAVEALP